MTETDLDTALDELDRLINDPEVRMDPDRVWALLAEVTLRSAGGGDGFAEARPPSPTAAADAYAPAR